MVWFWGPETKYLVLGPSEFGSLRSVGQAVRASESRDDSWSQRAGGVDGAAVHLEQLESITTLKYIEYGV